MILLGESEVWLMERHCVNKMLKLMFDYMLKEFYSYFKRQVKYNDDR